MNRQSNDRPVELSPQGRQRKQDMLGELQNSLQRVHWQRRARLAGAVSAAAVLLVSAIVLMGQNGRSGETPHSELAGINPESSAVSLVPPVVVQNRPELVSSVLVRSSDSLVASCRVEKISDTELQDLVSTFKKELTVARIDGRLIVVPHRAEN